MTDKGQILSTDKGQILSTVRERLTEALQLHGVSQAALAQRAGVDRSTLTRLMSASHQRIPRLDTVVAIAAEQGISIDWLVGLSNRGPVQARLVDTEFERSEDATDDERLLSWFAETAGHKVRHVPETIPDLVKTEAVIRYESARRSDEAAEAQARVETSAARRALSRSPDTEIEVCSSLQALTAIAHGEGVWSRLDREARQDQLDQIAELAGELYPRFRWFLYDGASRYAAPITIFGPHRAALYLGPSYLVLTSVEHVRVLIRDFDDVIRSARVQPPDIGTHVARLRAR